MTCYVCGCEMLPVAPFDPPRWLHLWEGDCDLQRVLVPFAYAKEITLNVSLSDDAEVSK